MMDMLTKVVASVLTAIAVAIVWRWLAKKDRHSTPNVLRYGRRFRILMWFGMFFFGWLLLNSVFGIDQNDPMYVFCAVVSGLLFSMTIVMLIESHRRRIEITEAGLQARVLFGSTFAAWEDIVDVRASRWWTGHVIMVRYGRSIPVPGVTFHDVETLRLALKQRAAGLAGHALLAQSWERNPAARLPNREEGPVG